LPTIEDAAMVALKASPAADGRGVKSHERRTGNDLIAALQVCPYREIEIEPIP
jgi:hypothetical protein